MEVKRGDIFYANLTARSGSVQCGQRPVLVIQNNIGNAHSPTTLVVPLTSRWKKRNLPTHVMLPADPMNGLKCDSVVLAEQIQTLDISSFTKKLGHVANMSAIDQALKVSIALA